MDIWNMRKRVSKLSNDDTPLDVPGILVFKGIVIRY